MVHTILRYDLFSGPKGHAVNERWSMARNPSEQTRPTEATWRIGCGWALGSSRCPAVNGSFVVLPAILTEITRSSVPHATRLE